MNTGSTRTTPEVGLDCVRSITLEGVPWAWCPTTRARAGQDKQWLRPLPGIVSVRTTPLWEVIEYRQAESVADLVRLYRPTLGKSSAIILWTYCSDMRVKNAVLCELEIKRQERLVRMKVSSAKRDAQLARLRQQVQDLQRRMAV